MREIKFRGKTKKEGWVYGLLTQKRLTDGKLNYAIVQGGDSTIPVLEESIGEFTGLKDKNGVEIYEGDILIAPNAKRGLVVCWTGGGFEVRSLSANSFESLIAVLFLECYEVIGNVFD